MPKEMTKTQGLTLLHHQGTREGCGNETLTLGEGRRFLGGNKKCCDQVDRVVFFFPLYQCIFLLPWCQSESCLQVMEKNGGKSIEW